MRIPMQRGYALLAMSVLLIGVGAGLLSHLPGQGVSASFGFQSLAGDHQVLLDARQSLLSYTALYPYLYGPTGAGPGHMPCPDTDFPGRVLANQTPFSGVGKDGPNPPCADPLLSRGRLPRHTVLPGYRYLFHAQPSQRLSYVVSGDVVNNPLNRLLNLSDFFQHDAKPVSIVSLASVDARATRARVALTKRQLATAVAPAVALWVTQKINTRMSHACNRQPVPEQTTASEVLEVDAYSCTEVSAADDEHCRFDRLLVLLLDPPIVPSEHCVSDNLTEQTLEGVPAKRHWFIHNFWHLSVSIDHSGACDLRLEQSPTCQLVYLPLIVNTNQRSLISHTQDGVASLNFRWVTKP